MTKNQSEIYEWLQDDESKSIFQEYHSYVSNFNEWYEVSIEPLLSLCRDRPYIMFGLGNLGRRYLDILVDNDLLGNLYEIWDNDVTLDAFYLDSIKITKPHKLPDDSITVLITPCAHQVIRDMLCLTETLHITNCKVIWYGTGNFLVKQREAWLKKAGKQHQYFDPEIIIPRLAENEYFIDCGCFDFKSSLDFIKLSPNPYKVSCFEASPNNLNKVENNIKSCGLKNVELFNCAVWDCDATLNFSTTPVGYADSITKTSAKNSTQVKAGSLDELLNPNEKTTYIKYDIEGAEMQGLVGAKNIILRDKPKLAISVYHKPQDYWELASYVKSLVPAYKAYLRHEQGDVFETLLYCVL